jgi:hypothetical protein
MERKMPGQKITLQEFLLTATRLCVEYSCSITSWIRTEARNKRVGGKANSTHLMGFGLDLVPDDPARKRSLIDAAHEAGLDAVDEGNHVHIEVDPPNQA